MERTLILVKPDGVKQGLVGTILSRFEQRGLKIVALKLMQMDEGLAKRHYAVHQGKAFFAELVQFITSGPLVAAVLDGPNAVEVARATMGTTDPAKAAPGTIRGDLASSVTENLVHGSDSRETADREIALFFTPEEIVNYDRSFLRRI